MLRIL